MNKPKIRFKESDDFWQKKQLENVASFSKGAGYSKADISSSGTALFLYGRLYTDFKIAYWDIDTYTTVNRKSVISTGREVLIPASGETAEEISVAAALLKSNVLIGGDINIIRPNSVIDPVFLALQVCADRLKSILSSRAQGKTVAHLHNSDLKSLEILYPFLGEQQEIGSFFSELDDTIAARRKKLTKLQQTKTSLLQKMFPQGDAVEPELRIKGFTGAWQYKAFGDVASLTRGLTYTPNDVIHNRDGQDAIRVLRSSNISDNIFHTNDDDVFVKASCVNKPLLQNGDILITASNGSTRLVGKHAIVVNHSGEPLVHGGFMLIARSQCSEFLQASMSSTWYQNFVSLHVSGGNGAIGNLDSQQLSEQFIRFPPTLAEQRAIGELFAQLDDLIAAEQLYVEKLRQVKASLLQKMFV